MKPLIEFEVPIYQYQIALFLVHSEVPEQFKKHGEGCWCASTSQGSVLHVPMPGGKMSSRFIHNLSHELNHAAMDLLHSRGVQVNHGNQEVLCYTQGYMIEYVLEKLFG